MTQLNTHANSEWELTWLWLNKIDFSESSPQAMNVAANSLIDFLSSNGFCHTVIACKSTIQYKVSFPALWNFTKFLTAPK